MTILEKIFGKKQKKEEREGTSKKPEEMPIEMPKLKGESLAIYNSLLNGLDRMKKEGITRMYLFSQEMEPDKDAFGKWIDMNDTVYYPYSMLDPREQELILTKKHYSIGALVSDKIQIDEEHGLKSANYPSYGFEVFERTHIHPMLCKMKDGPETINRMEYYRKYCFYNPEQMKLIAEQMTKAKATAKEVEEMINQGIKNYKVTTQILMEKAGVNDSLKKLEERIHLNRTEELLAEIREQIDFAKVDSLG